MKSEESPWRSGRYVFAYYRGLCSYSARLFNDDVTAIGLSYWRRKKFSSYARLHRGRIQNLEYFSQRNAPEVMVVDFPITVSPGWRLLSQFPPFRCLPYVSALSQHTLAIKYSSYIWQVPPQLAFKSKMENLFTEKLTDEALVTPTPEWMIIYFMRKTTRLKSGWGFGQTNSPPKHSWGPDWCCGAMFAQSQWSVTTVCTRP